LKRGETLELLVNQAQESQWTNLSIIRLIPDPPGRIVGVKSSLMDRTILLLSGKEVKRFVDDVSR
jgi:hypothetical protein